MTIQTKHDWQLAHDFDGDYAIFEETDNYLVCSTYGDKTRDYEAALLIAAAPALLAALENLVASDLWQDRPEMQKAKEAIQKARGE